MASEQGREQIAASLFLALKEVLSRMPPQPLDRVTIRKRGRTIYGGIINSAKMGASDRDRVTAIVEEASDGVGLDKTAIDELIPLLYSEMRRLAQWHLGRFGNRTLQATAVVHEAYLKLVDQKKVNWRGRAHFLAVASKVMRNLLIDEARKRTAQKRGGGWQRVTMAEGVLGAVELNFDELLHLDAALSALEEHDRREAIVVELRFFGGLRVDEVAEVLGVSKRTAEECWTHARAWLRRELSRG